MLPAVQIIDKLAWLHIVDRRILGARSRGRDTVYIPGGKREQGESDHDALVREIREELSVELIPGQLRLFGTFEAQAHGKPEGVRVRMTCYEGPYTGVIRAAAEIEEVLWLQYRDRDSVSPVARMILDGLKSSDRID
jgi:8-oxo-dGTP diphosphatase